MDRRDGVMHLLGYEGDHLAAYARIMAPGIGDDTRSLAVLLAYIRALDAAGADLAHVAEQFLEEAFRLAERCGLVVFGVDAGDLFHAAALHGRHIALFIEADDQDLLLQEGWRIMVVLVTSTVLVLGTTALVVDRVYRLELKLARRSRRHV